jgi:hypothetical protein
VHIRPLLDHDPRGQPLVLAQPTRPLIAEFEPGRHIAVDDLGRHRANPAGERPGTGLDLGGHADRDKSSTAAVANVTTASAGIHVPHKSEPHTERCRGHSGFVGAIREVVVLLPD